MTEVYSARFQTTLTAAVGTARPTTISVAHTQTVYAGGSFSIAIYNAGTDANPVNYEVLQVTAGGGSLNWTVVNEPGWGSFSHASGSTVVATLLTPRSLQQPLLDHTTFAKVPDPHSQYVGKSSYSARGDLQVGTGTGAYTRVPVGPPGTVPIATPTATSGVQWGIPSVGTILQHVGDLIVGTLGGVATRLGIGNYGQVLTSSINTPRIATPSTAPVVTAGTITGTMGSGPFDFFYAWQTGSSPDGGTTGISPVTTFFPSVTRSANVQCPPAPAANATLLIYAGLHAGLFPPVLQQSFAASTAGPNTAVITAIATSGTASPGSLNTSGGISAAWQNPPSVFGTEVSGTDFLATGLGPVGGGTASGRFVGSVATGHPIAGPWLAGDFSVDRTGSIWVCTVAGTPGTWTQASTGSTFSGEVSGTDFKANGITGTLAARFVGSTGGGAPLTGTFQLGDFVVDQTGPTWVCTVAGTPGTWVEVGATLATSSLATSYKAIGISGASAASRYAGGTASGAPTSGTFALGDYVVDETGSFWICTVAGSPGTWLQGGSTLAGQSLALDYKPTGVGGATAASRYVGATASGIPGSGTYVLGDWIIDQTAKIWICTVGGSPGTWSQVNASPAFTTEVSAPDFRANGVTGATQASRYVGATTSAAPTSGTFSTGDFSIDRSGTLWVCTSAGSPGTWHEVGHATGAFPGEVSGTDFAASGLTGASSARFVGGTASGPPSTGTFLQGDFVIDKTGFIWACISAGSPGTWANIVTSGLSGSTSGSTSSNSIAADVLLTTPSTFYAGPTLSLAAGIWLLIGTTTYSGAAARVTAKLWSGSGSALDSAETTITGSTDVHSVTVSGVVQPSTVTSYEVSATATAAGVSMRAATPDNPAGNTASTLVAWSIAQPSANFVGQEVSGTDFAATGLTGATAGARFVGATSSGAPVTGSFSAGDFTIDRTGQIWICITSGSPGTWVDASQNPAAVSTALGFSATGITGATLGGRFVGGTTSGAPSSGTFLVGDFIIDHTGLIWVCITAGTPGTWVDSSENPTAVESHPAYAVTGLTGATTGTRYVGATAAGAPTTGTFLVGDFTVDLTGKMWVCTVGGAPGTWVQVGSNLGAESQATDYKPSGLTGATAASRYAGATVGGAPTTGTFVTGDWVVDQSGKLWICTIGGTPGTWTLVAGAGGGGGGALVPITVIGPLASTQASVTFSAIPQTYRNLRLVLVARGDTAASSTTNTIVFNGDTTAADYTSETGFIGAGSSVSAAQRTGNPYGWLGTLLAASSSANVAESSEVFIPNYVGTAFYKQWHSMGMSSGGSTTNVFKDDFTGIWISTAAITSITLAPSAGNYIAGSYFALYGELDNFGSTQTGTMVPMATVGPLTAAQASVTFSAIPATYRNLIVKGVARGDTAATSTFMQMQFNGDTGANYDSAVGYANVAGTAIGGGAVASTSMQVAEITAGSAPAGPASPFWLTINSYTSTTFHRDGTGQSGMVRALSAANIYAEYSYFSWRNTASPITSLTLFPAAGNFAAGSYFCIYGELDTFVPAPGGNGALQPIATVGPLGSAQLTISFTSIPQTYRNLRLVANGASNAAVTSTSVLMQLNGDTGTNYDWFTSTSGSATIAATSITLGSFNGTSAPAGTASPLKLTIHDYISTTFNKDVLVEYGDKTSTATNGLGVFQTIGYWRNSAAVTGLQLTLASGSFAVGSYFALYGELDTAPGSGEVVAADFHPTGLTGAMAGSRYVGATTSGAPTSGTFQLGDFVVDQTGKLWICTTAGTSGAWTQVAGSGGGGGGATGAGSLVPLQVIGPISSAVANVTFSGIPQTYRNLVLVSTARSDNATTTLTATVVVNGDTGSNYYSQTGYTVSTGYVSNTESAPGAAGLIAEIPGTSAPTSVAAQFVAQFLNYSGTSFHKAWHTEGMLDWTNSTASHGHILAQGRWANTAGITSLQLAPSAGNFDVGSYFCLYGEADTPPIISSGTTGSVLQPIATVGPLLSAQASAAFTGLPSTFRNFVVEWTARGTNVSSQILGMQFNGDTGANYDYYTVVGAATSTAQTAARVGVLTASGEAAGHASSGRISLRNVIGTSFWKSYTSMVWRSDNTTSEPNGGQWHNTAAITSLTLLPATGNLDVGSYFVLYGELDTVPALTTGTIDVIIDGVGAAIGTGVRGDVRIDAACTITGWSLYADQSGSIVVDIWKAPSANFPPASGNTITGSALPTLSSAVFASSTTLTGWTTAINAGDILRYNVNSAATVTRVTVALTITRSH